MESLQSQVPIIYKDDSPQLTYYSRPKSEKEGVIHWGQRKLLLSEIRFLTQYGHLAKIVVYAGAAPSDHTPYLQSLFPEHVFILIDPRPFSIKPTNKIKIIQDYFSDEMATNLAFLKILFISDIRTADWRANGTAESEEDIVKDNENQMRWVNIMKPEKSMLKFRCTYANTPVGRVPTKMFKGTIDYQVYAPSSSTETRLIPDDNLAVVTYDNKVYEDILFHHNVVERIKTKYKQPIVGEGLNDSYDSAYEVLILWEFLQKFPSYQSDQQDLNKSISQMSYDMSRNISNHWTLTNRLQKLPDKPFFQAKNQNKYRR